MNIKCMTFSPIQVNTYLVWDNSKNCLVIDAGMYNEMENQIFDRFIAENELSVKMLLNTHLHFDHIFGSKHIAEKYNVLPIGGEQDNFLVDSFTLSAQRFGINANSETVPLNGYIHEGEMITLGDIELMPIHTPGHSPGSYSFYAAKDGVLFSGDALFNGAIGRTDLPQGDYSTLLKSIEQKLFSLPDSTVVYPGHGPKTSIAHEKIYNPFF